MQKGIMCSSRVQWVVGSIPSDKLIKFSRASQCCPSQLVTYSVTGVSKIVVCMQHDQC